MIEDTLLDVHSRELLQRGMYLGSWGSPINSKVFDPILSVKSNPPPFGAHQSPLSYFLQSNTSVLRRGMC
jgi:hypothetical protein